MVYPGAIANAIIMNCLPCRCHYAPVKITRLPSFRTVAARLMNLANNIAAELAMLLNHLSNQLDGTGYVVG